MQGAWGSVLGCGRVYEVSVGKYAGAYGEVRRGVGKGMGGLGKVRRDGGVKKCERVWESVLGCGG